jgi:hypothetical protein
MAKNSAMLWGGARQAGRLQGKENAKGKVLFAGTDTMNTNLSATRCHEVNTGWWSLSPRWHCFGLDGTPSLWVGTRIICDEKERLTAMFTPEIGL